MASFLNTKDLARELRLSESDVIKYRNAGLFPSYGETATDRYDLNECKQVFMSEFRKPYGQGAQNEAN